MMNPIYKFFLNKGSGNEIAPGLMSKGRSVNPLTGELNIIDSYQATAFMPVTASLEYVFRNSTGTVVSIPQYAYYNKNKAFISGGTNGGALTIPEGAAFIRISFILTWNAADYSFCRSSIGYSPYVSEQVFPIYRNDLTKNYDKELNEVFFRAGLSGNLTFVAKDYDWIVLQAFDFKFRLTIYISYDAGQTWDVYWTGMFYKTDCTFDGFKKTVVVKPETYDQYTDLLPLLDREFNIVSLSPAIRRTWMDKPCVIQFYNPGDSQLTCVARNNRVWEEGCSAITDLNELVNHFHFGLIGSLRTVQFNGEFTPPVPRTYTGPIPVSDPPEFAYSVGQFVFKCVASPAPLGGYTYKYSLFLVNDEMWTNTLAAPSTDFVLLPVEGTSASGNIHVLITDNQGEVGVYGRILTDDNTAQFELPLDDIVTGNRTHRRVLPFISATFIQIGEYLTTEPTEYGRYDDVYYYAKPPSGEFLPIVRSKWGSDSYWFIINSDSQALLNSRSTHFEMLLNYDFGSVLQVILTALKAGLNTSHVSSHFFGDEVNPITGGPKLTLALTPKSNVIVGGTMTFEEAKKGNLSLRGIFDMLRDCFRCYWYVDESGTLHIEHIKYFMNGGSYDTTPETGINLTELYDPRSGKALAYGQELYKFDKPAMTSRYTFAWMDEVSQPFEGYPIEVVSSYVDKSNTEEIKIAKFTSDLDFIMISSDIDRDGFALMSIEETVPFYEVPYWNDLQNGYLSFDYLRQYYFWDMPASWYSINGYTYRALGIKKLKGQEVNFPALRDPDLYKTIRTEIGDGVIEKLSINLSSRNANATLKYDTE